MYFRAKWPFGSSVFFVKLAGYLSYRSIKAKAGVATQPMSGLVSLSPLECFTLFSCFAQVCFPRLSGKSQNNAFDALHSKAKLWLLTIDLTDFSLTVVSKGKMLVNRRFSLLF